MTRRLNSRIHFVCVAGDSDIALLPHLVDHYRSLGIESFYVIRHAESEKSPGYSLMASTMESVGIDLFHTHVGPWSLELNQRLIRFAMRQNPDDWYVVADSDELQLYDRPIEELVVECERVGATHVNGCFLDRIASDGGFPRIGPGSLWTQFPLAGSISAGLLRALPIKVGLARGDVELYTGQHGTVHGRGLSRSESFIQFHHFKWSESVVGRLQSRIDRFGEYRDDPSYEAIIQESERFLFHIRSNDGLIDTSDFRFRLHRCGDGHADYPEWDHAISEALQWKWAII